MLLLGQYPPLIDELVNRANREADLLLAALPEGSEIITLIPQERLYTKHDTGSIYLVRQGLLLAELEHRATFVLQPGDMAGLEQQLFPCPTNYFGEEPVELARYDWTDFQSQLSREPKLLEVWLRYLHGQQALFSLAFGEIIRDQQRPQATFLRFRPGETIIHQGEDAQLVYTLMRGKADAFRDGIEVGKVEEGEIFGAIAALTDEPRNATVIASSEATVMAIPREQFSGLLRSHPDTCLHLLRSMARTINDLNHRVSQQAGDIRFE